jgi:hypothetical protein
MTDQQKHYSDVIEATLERVREILIVKGKEYHRNNNPLHTPQQMARILNQTDIEATNGAMIKQFSSYLDMIQDVKDRKDLTMPHVNEKIDDILVYLLIQKVQFADYIERQTLFTDL